MQVFPTIVIKYSQMVSWLNKDVDVESDLMVWGKEQSSYTFADLKKWVDRMKDGKNGLEESESEGSSEGKNKSKVKSKSKKAVRK